MLSKIRPNVIVLAALVAGLTGYLAVLLIAKTDVIVSNEILALLVGVGIGGLVGVMSAVSQDPPPPTVPAGTFEKVVARLVEVEQAECDCAENNDA